MLIYILNYLSIPLYQFFVKNKKWLVLLLSLQMFLILALRAPDLGADLENYAGGYAYIASLSFGDMLSRLRLVGDAVLTWPYAYDSGYVVLNWLVGATGADFHDFLVVVAFLTMLSFGVYIYRYSQQPWLSFCFLVSFEFYSYAFGILRQTLALAILLFAIPMMEKRQTGRFLLLLFLAFTFHKTAIVFGALYLLSHLTFNRQMYLAALGTLGVFLMVGPVVIPWAVKLLLALAGRSGYLDRVAEESSGTFVIFLFLIGVCIYLFADFQKIEHSPRENLFLSGFILSIPTCMMGLYNVTFGRVNELFLVTLVVLIPNILEEYEDRRWTLLGQIGLTVFLFGFMVFLLSGSEELVPYRSIFS